MMGIAAAALKLLAGYSHRIPPSLVAGPLSMCARRQRHHRLFQDQFTGSRQERKKITTLFLSSIMMKSLKNNSLYFRLNPS